MWWRRVRYVLVLVALCAIATCPTAQRACSAKNESREADDLLEYLADRVAAITRSTGRVPPLPAGPTPQPNCCDQGGVCSPDKTTFAAPGWTALGFSIDGDYHYTYEYLPDPSGAFAVIRATGDLDCNGATSVHEVKVASEPGAGGAAVTRAWTYKNRYE
ncbi:MAG: hypothetical protein NT062_25855 [Proteobacteria bacterium]|nr:hypothetical protein [Pseudomonadota bacterium]